MGAFKAMNLISIWNSGTSTEVSHVFRILSVDVDLCIVQRVELLGSDQSVAGDSWLFLPPGQEGAVLLKDVVHGRQLLLVGTLDTIGDIGSKDISVNRDEQLSRVVGIVISWPGLASRPESQRINGNNHVLEGEGADEPFGGLILVGTFCLDNKVELLVFEVRVDRIDDQKR